MTVEFKRVVNDCPPEGLEHPRQQRELYKLNFSNSRARQAKNASVGAN